VRDQSTVLSASSLLSGQYGMSNVCLSLPTVINRLGVARVLQLDLDEGERQQLTRSAEILSANIAELGLY